MKIVIAGGTGLIGKKLAARLASPGREIVAAAPSTGVDLVSGAGLVAALAGADVVVDVTNSPSFDDQAVHAFFAATTRNLIAAARAAGVGHYVALSIVGVDRLPGSGYFRAKLAQEAQIVASGLPHTILRATQFFEFVGAIAAAGDEGDFVRLSSRAFQPIAADDVAAALADIVLAAPVDGIVEVAGPERRPLAEFAADWMVDNGEDRPVVVDPDAPYFGAPLADDSLVPLGVSRIGATRFADWLARSLASA